MPWARLDDTFHGHPKTADAGTLGVGLFALALSYSSQYLTDGFISVAVVHRLISDVEDPIAVAEQLVKARYFDLAEGGYMIHDYLEYNPSRAKVLKDREDAKARMQAVRGHRERGKAEQAPPDAECSDEVRANKAETSPNPVPGPTPVPGPIPGPQDGAGAAAPGETPPVDKPPKATRSPDSEAVAYLWSVGKVRLKDIAKAKIDAAVLPGDLEALARWREAVDAWLLRGFKPTNVAGMLDWFYKGPPAHGGNGARASPAGPPIPKSWPGLRRYMEKEGLPDGK